MITSEYVNMNDSPLRRIKGKVELYNNSTLSQTFSYDDNLQEITIERTGEKGKFFLMQIKITRLRFCGTP